MTLSCIIGVDLTKKVQRQCLERPRRHVVPVLNKFDREFLQERIAYEKY